MQIGGTTEAARNIISGNNGDGIGFSVRTGTTIQGNFIGIRANGSPLGNGGDGISCCGLPGAAGGNLIGGVAEGAGNVIAHNGEQGIRVGANLTAIGSLASILRNSIHSNGALGIDLSGRNPGSTPNDPGDGDPGPNGLQNFPSCKPVVSGGGKTTVTGILDSQASLAGIVYRLEFFANAACDSSGFGEGKTFLGAKDVTIDGSNASGRRLQPRFLRRRSCPCLS